MRILFLILLISGSLPIPVMGQVMSDSSFYYQGIRMIAQAKTAGDYKMAASYFEDFGGRKPVQWLELYYAALSYIHASFKTETDKTKDELMDKAQPLIDRAFSLKPEEPELMVLQAFLYQSRMQINPVMRGLTYSMKADASLKKAAEADAGNPRAWSLMGYNIFYTPAAFGGGPHKALPYFLKARDKYLSFSPALPFMPKWGEPENQEMIAECKKSIK